MTQLNHGFYNINPTLLYDFHQDNGFESRFLQGLFNRIIDGKQQQTGFKIPFIDRFRVTQYGDVETSLIYIAERTKVVEEFVKPVQRKYRAPSQWV